MRPELVIFLIWFGFMLYALKEISWAIESKRELRKRIARSDARIKAIQERECTHK